MRTSQQCWLYIARVRGGCEWCSAWTNLLEVQQHVITNEAGAWPCSDNFINGAHSAKQARVIDDPPLEIRRRNGDADTFDCNQPELWCKSVAQFGKSSVIDRECKIADTSYRSPTTPAQCLARIAAQQVMSNLPQAVAGEKAEQKRRSRLQTASSLRHESSYITHTVEPSKIR